MASTRSKNNEADYNLEQKSNTGLCNYFTCQQNNYGNPVTTHFAGDGLLQGRIAPNQLASNPWDIESQLFGIGTSNMVIKKPNVSPGIHTIQSLNIINRLPVLLPEPVIVEKGQRPTIMK